MKYPLFIVAIVIAFYLPAVAQQKWINYKIDSRLSVQLPAQPQSSQDGSIIAVQKDTIVCVITSMDFLKKSGLDSATFAADAPTQSFADEIKAGMLSQMPGFTVGNVKIGRWKNHVTYAFDGSQDAQKLNDFTYIIVIGRYLYAISALIPQSKSTAPKDYFFNSIVEN